MVVADYQTVALQMTEREGQHPLRYAAHAILDLREAQSLVGRDRQERQDEDRPLVSRPGIRSCGRHIDSLMPRSVTSYGQSSYGQSSYGQSFARTATRYLRVTDAQECAVLRRSSHSLDR